MRDFEPQFHLLSELQRLGERAFIHKLKEKNPGVTAEEIAIEVDRWYLQRPPGNDYGFSSRLDVGAFDPKNI